MTRATLVAACLSVIVLGARGGSAADEPAGSTPATQPAGADAPILPLQEMTDAEADELFLEAIRAQRALFTNEEWAKIETLSEEAYARMREAAKREERQEIESTLAMDLRALLTPEQAQVIDEDVRLRARDLPIRQCAANLRSIGQAMHIYAVDHKGGLPPDLGTLCAEEDVGASPALVLCPLSGKTLPAGFENLGLDERIDWINGNTDYEYFGKDLKLAGLQPTVVAQDKPGHKHPVVLGDHGEVTGKARINVLDSTGHVEARWE
jgi:hypothetical protein